jgi:glycosyltransferase involved in cell wall biosynthesis
VRWLARQERHALLADVIPTFSMFVYPSRCDGTPLTLLEVMACGIPAVVSDYKALPEVVDYGRAGRIVSGQNVDGLVSAILSLMDLSERRRLGRAARERVMAHYTAAVTIPELGRVYRSVLSARLS